jgi:hypothetical protein
MKPELILIPQITIHPDRICLYREVKWIPIKKCSNSIDIENSELEDVNQAFLHSKRKNNGFLSITAKKKLFKAIDYLMATSEKKKVYSKVQSKYITYRIVFVTLTLPSRQVHTDKEITNTCLNQLFTELKMYHNVKRYVWRAEKQANGNIHYHILFNQFVEWSELRKRWNRICNKLGYVDEYQRTMKEFYSKGFRPSNNVNDKRTVEQQRKAFVIGQKSDWTSPNSTDIHDTRKVTNLKKYVGKYMAKQPEVNIDNIKDEKDVRIVEGRLWSCSQDLSKVSGCQLVEDWELSDALDEIVQISKCKVFKDTYFSVIFIDFHDLIKYSSGLLYRYFANYLIDTFDFNPQSILPLAS